MIFGCETDAVLIMVVTWCPLNAHQSRRQLWNNMIRIYFWYKVSDKNFFFHDIYIYINESDEHRKFEFLLLFVRLWKVLTRRAWEKRFEPTCFMICLSSLCTSLRFCWQEYSLCQWSMFDRFRHFARFIRTVCMRRIRWSCEGLTSVHNEYTGYTLKHLLLRHMYNLLLPVLLCYARALRSETSYCYCWSGSTLLVDWTTWALCYYSHALYCAVLYILLV